MAVADRAQDAAAPEISTATGRVRGERDGVVAVFRGIPFALPPVGDRRFAAPAPVPAWAGAREAVAFGPPPPQGGHFGMEALSDDGDGDWLTLNVWTAEPDRASRLPVLVWVQGGGYVIGTSGLPEYDGARLARENGVVVVTFNYRVGIEGFAQIEGAPANRGLLDQVAALEWVRDNVAAFGGDPERVTVFGQSAGAGSIAALLAMPRASGLFARAVVQSVPGTFFSPELAADIAAACAAELGLRATVADLSTVAPGELCRRRRRRRGGHARAGPSLGAAGVPLDPVLAGGRRRRAAAHSVAGARRRCRSRSRAARRAHPRRAPPLHGVGRSRRRRRRAGWGICARRPRART